MGWEVHGWPGLKTVKVGEEREEDVVLVPGREGKGLAQEGKEKRTAEEDRAAEAARPRKDDMQPEAGRAGKEEAEAARPRKNDRQPGAGRAGKEEAEAARPRTDMQPEAGRAGKEEAEAARPRKDDRQPGAGRAGKEEAEAARPRTDMQPEAGRAGKEEAEAARPRKDDRQPGAGRTADMAADCTEVSLIVPMRINMLRKSGQMRCLLTSPPSASIEDWPWVSLSLLCSEDSTLARRPRRGCSVWPLLGPNRTGRACSRSRSWPL